MNTTSLHLPHGEKLSAVLPAASAFINDLDDAFEFEKTRINEIASRLETSRFHLAVLGQFKRGKSTLLNALLGAQLLPSAVVPLTSVPTYLSWNKQKIARVTFANKEPVEFTTDDTGELSKFLAKYVTEEGNPKNRLGVRQVEVGYPSTLLHNGVVLIDTPGIGSTYQHNTEATLSFIPNCDAALFLVSADPPVTQVELEFLKSIMPQIARFFFIMNKVDYLNDNELKEAVEFFRRVLNEQIGMDGHTPVLCISARLGLEAQLKHSKDIWKSSGMSEVEDLLIKFLAEEKNRILTIALSRKAIDVFQDVLLRLRLQQRSLMLPLDDLEQRLSIFANKLKEAESQRIRAQDLLAGDKKRTIELIDEQSGVLFRSYFQQLCNETDKLLDNAKDLSVAEKEIRKNISDFIPKVFNQELGKIARQMDRHVNEIIGAYQKQLLELVETVRRSAADIFEISYGSSYGEDILELKHKPFWVTEEWKINWSPLPENWFESLLPANARRKRVRKRLVADIDAIISNNIDNLRWATVCNVTDSFYAFGLELDRQIKRIIESTTGAIEAARRLRTEKSGNIEIELKKIAARIEEAESIQSKLRSIEAALSG